MILIFNCPVINTTIVESPFGSPKLAVNKIYRIFVDLLIFSLDSIICSTIALHIDVSKTETDLMIYYLDLCFDIL